MRTSTIRVQKSSIIRSFSEAEAVVNVSASPSSGGGSENPVGGYYHDMVYRGRGHNALSLGDLRKLMQMCNTPELARYSLNGVDLYQRKGQDFSEEVNSHFVRSVAIDGQQAVTAAKVLAKWKNRLGAWSTTTSLEKLLRAMVEQGQDGGYTPQAQAAAVSIADADGDDEEANGEEEKAEAEAVDIAALTVEVLEVSHRKGVHIARPVFEVALQLVPEVSEAPPAPAAAAEEEEEAEGDAETEAPAAEVSGPPLRERLRAVAAGALGEDEAATMFN
jgi:hypothetical protein